MSLAARGRRRSCPSSRLTPTAPGTGTPSQVSPNVQHGGHDVQRFFGAGVGGNNLVASLLDKATGAARPANAERTRLHRADAWHRARHRHGSARARPDSPDFRPLHSATRTARRLRGRFAAFRRIGNYRDRRERACAARSGKISEAAMLRISAKPSNSPQCFARARHRH
jgi:hypothetical protein